MSEITLNEFKAALESGKYGSLAGARRGAGKIQGWSEEMREKAKRLADAHFGAESGAKASKSAAKAGGAPKKRGRPPGSKNKTKTAAAPKKPAKVAAAKPAPKAATPKTPRAPRAAAPSGAAKVEELLKVVGTMSEALKAMKEAQSFVSPGDLRSEAVSAGQILSSAVTALGNLVVGPIKAATGAQAPAAGEAEKPAGKKRGRKPAAVTTLTAPEATTEAPAESAPESTEPAAEEDVAHIPNSIEEAS